jgi:sugar phosphate isomerase/epimerase
MHADDEWGRSGAPPLNIAAVEKRDRIAAMDEIKRAIEVAEQIPFNFLVQHVGVGGESATGQKLEAAMTSLEHLRAFAKPLAVQIVVENISNELSTPESLVELIRASRFTDVGVCFDLGHAHMAAGVPQAFEALKDLIRTTHVHDNSGERDAHLWPGKGTINWKETLALLSTAPHVPPLVLEIEGVEGENVSEKMAETYSELEV